MSERKRTSRRPGVALIGLGIAVTLTISACGGSSGGSSSTTQTSTPAAMSAPATQASTTATTSTGTTTSEGGLSGKWNGTYSGAYSGTFALDWTQSGSTLSGHINLPSAGGTSNVTGTVDATSIRFGTVGGPGITYKGSVSGDSMSGTYSTPGGGGSWSAHRA